MNNRESLSSRAVIATLLAHFGVGYPEPRLPRNYRAPGRKPSGASKKYSGPRDPDRRRPKMTTAKVTAWRKAMA